MIGTKLREFKAHDNDGEEHTIHVCKASGVTLLYMDDEERLLIRLRKGCYLHGNFPLLDLTSDDPDAE